LESISGINMEKGARMPLSVLKLRVPDLKIKAVH